MGTATAHVQEDTRPKKPFYKKWWVWVLGILFIGLIGSASDDETATEQPAASVAASAPADPKKVLWQHAEKAFLDAIIEQKGDEQLAVQIDTLAGGALRMTCAYTYGTSWDNEGMRRGIVNDAMDISKNVLADSTLNGVRDLQLQVYSTLTDKYGQETSEMVGRAAWDRALIQRINWTNMDADRFSALLRESGELWYHPALMRAE